MIAYHIYRSDVEAYKLDFFCMEKAIKVVLCNILRSPYD